jgi:hypothetical protein
MKWKFEPILSIRVLHQRMQEVPLVDPDAYTPEFSVEPSPDTLHYLKRMGWIAKPMPNGIRVFGEKIIREDGSSFYRQAPEDISVLTFLVRLNDHAILEETSPFVLKREPLEPNEDLPAFSGKSRLLYFDNLSVNVQPLPDDGEILVLTKGEYVGEPEFASQAVSPFLMKLSKKDITDVVATSIGPGDKVKEEKIKVPSGSQSVFLELEENAWQITPKPDGEQEQEIIYLSSKPFPEKVFGIIRIFNTETHPLTEFRRFQALFARAE